VETLTPEQIEDESMRIIEREAGPHQFKGQEWAVARRIIHATADFDFIHSLRIHREAVSAGMAAIRRGCTLYTDTAMLAAGIDGAVTGLTACSILCCIGDADVRRQSAETGETRSACALRKAAPQLDHGIIAIGNAPTALQEALVLVRNNSLRPALIIGLPVGFVGAVEAKKMLSREAVPFITNLSRRGGTAAAAAVIHALIRLAADR